MNFFNRIKLAFNKTAFERYLETFLGGGDLETSDSLVLKYSAVFACVRILSETFASVNVGEFKKNRQDMTRKPTNDTGLFDLLRNVPNSYMSAYNFWEMALVQLNTGSGNFFCYKDKNSTGQVIQLRPILDENVEVKIEDGIIKYKITRGEDEITKTREDIFHIPGFSEDGIIGLSPLTYFSNMVSLGKAYETFSNQYFKNGVLPSGNFEIPTKLKDEAYNQLKKDIQSNYGGLGNAGVPMLLENGLTFKPVTINPADAQLLASRKFQVEEINRVYRVPLHLSQSLDKATNNNIEHQSLEFIMYTMLPWFKRAEMAINTQLVTPNQRKNGYFFEFNIDSLLRGDQKSRSEAYRNGRNGGYLSANDVRRKENMNPIKNGDIYLQPVNMMEAGTTPPPSNNNNNDTEVDTDET